VVLGSGVRYVGDLVEPLTVLENPTVVRATG
jgi:hypothetical protein